MPGSLSNYAENKLLDMTFGGVPWNPPPILYFGYFVTAPAEEGAGTEPNSGNYARVGIENNSSLFPVTSNQIKTTALPVQFLGATANHGLVIAIGIFDALVNGNLLIYGQLEEPVMIETGDAFKLPPGFEIKFNATGTYSNFTKNSWLNHLLGGTPFNALANLFFGYSTTLSTPAVPGTEPTAGSYARVQAANTSLLFEPSYDGSKRLIKDINFVEADALQGTIVEGSVWTAQVGGNQLAAIPLGAPYPVGANVQPYFAANELILKLD
ncbi:hypothetical protein H6F43_03125 [Leptolyngbya sp. FACHB-36]|uniref:phage tail fiber protein n=1 Tax=Leptolyngbya sp. FACHB-36 TaxID=2692808 RepID=UPI0016801022|nr:hypothetical protein [Leptolyngbya sp. FACHB-36]MBD2019176.1 hypothetical protein [Leptolyngbya sp. FACHB-36]